MPLSPKSRLGTYEILSPLGAGGMGEVYRARDLRLGREIAIKVLPADVASSPDRLARFEREARTVAGLNHPNIVTLHSVEDEDGIRFLTMELVEGRTLSSLVAPGGLPLPKLLELAIPLADALAAAHERGVVHRDLKPGNVMVTREGRVKVLDFGLAKMIGTDSPDRGETFTMTTQDPISSERRPAGTVPYMAPEQIRGEEVDARSDLFSLGIILYELATGRRPFTGEVSIDVGHAILHDTPQPLSRIRADLPVDLERIVTWCLEKRPRERIQSALDVSNALRRLRKASEIGGPDKKTPEKVASIAVLPFVNRSRDEEDEYFSDGLADELLSVLSKIKGLRVTARTSSFHFKGKDATVSEIGKALNVATLLEGSVRKAGNRIRVSVRLVSVADSSHLWSETYDRTLEDILAVQDEIAHSVVKELRTTLLGEEADSDASGAAKAEVAQAAKGRGTDPEAHRLFLLARHLINRITREDTAKAIEYLKEALARDPAYVLAWTELSWAQAMGTGWGWSTPVEGYERAREAVERALTLQPDLPEGHARKGWIQMLYDWDFHGAEASLARALALLPGNAEVLRAKGVLTCILGRLDEGIGLLRQALEQDPLSAAAYRSLGFALHAAGRFPEAEAAYRESLELAPQRVAARANLSMTLIAMDRADEALAEALREPEEAYRLWALAISHHALGHGAESDAALQSLIEKYAREAAYQIAEVYGARGEIDAAFDWVERAYRQRDPGLSYVKIRVPSRRLHADPRWAALLKKMGLEE